MPNPTDERSIQGGLVMRGALGLARRLLRLEEATQHARRVRSREHSFTPAYPRDVCPQSSHLRQPAANSCPRLPGESITAPPGSCAWSGSTLERAPSIERPPLTAATADPLPPPTSK